MQLIDSVVHESRPLVLRWKGGRGGDWKIYAKDHF